MKLNSWKHWIIEVDKGELQKRFKKFFQDQDVSFSREETNENSFVQENKSVNKAELIKMVEKVYEDGRNEDNKFIINNFFIAWI